MVKIIQKIKNLDKKSKELQNKLDLKKKFPGYFNMWIFRCAFIFLLVVFCFGVYIDGFSPEPYYTCPEGGPRCENILYWCTQEYNILMDMKIQDCGDAEYICNKWEYLCTFEYLLPGESVGHKPSFISAHTVDIFFVTIIFAFGLNHLLYRRKRE